MADQKLQTFMDELRELKEKINRLELENQELRERVEVSVTAGEKSEYWQERVEKLVKELQESKVVKSGVSPKRREGLQFQ
jgi:predicted RNase H-like nuclease (RuvC/YqgF family)